MSAPQHTPGPLELRGLVVWERGKVALSVATVNHYHPHAQVHAHLFTAAPELLEALEALARHDFDDRDDPVIYNEVCRRARAAIAKARGAA